MVKYTGGIKEYTIIHILKTSEKVVGYDVVSIDGKVSRLSLLDALELAKQDKITGVKYVCRRNYTDKNTGTSEYIRGIGDTLHRVPITEELFDSKRMYITLGGGKVKVINEIKYTQDKATTPPIDRFFGVRVNEFNSIEINYRMRTKYSYLIKRTTV